MEALNIEIFLTDGKELDWVWKPVEAQETLSQQALLLPTSPGIADQLNLKFSMDFPTLATYGAHFKSIRIYVAKKLSLNLNLMEYLCCD